MHKIIKKAIALTAYGLVYVVCEFLKAYAFTLIINDLLSRV